MHQLDPHTIKDFTLGSRKAFEAVYDRYAGPLYGVILKMTGDQMVSNDVLQEVFLKIWNKREQYQPKKAQLFTWMYAICRNTVLDHLRKIDASIRFEDIHLAEFSVPHVSQDVDTLDLQVHLSDLDDKYKETLVALFFKGFTQREWSEKSGIPLGTIKTRLKIALRELRKTYIDLAVGLITYLIQVG